MITTENVFQRRLGFYSLLAVAIGLVISQGVMVIMLQGTGIAGYGFIIAMAIAYILALSYAISFSELALMFPDAGSLGRYTEVAIGHFPAIVAVFSGYIVVAMFALSAELVLIDLMLSFLLPDVFPTLTFAYGILIALTLLNIRGIDIFAKIQSVFAYFMIAALILVGIAAVFGLANAKPEFEPLLSLRSDQLNWGVLSLIAVAIWGFVGAEFVCPLVEETKQPNRNIPAAMFVGITLIMVIYVFYCFGALTYLPADTLTDASLPHLEYFKAVFGEEGVVFVAIAAIAATCSTVNTSLASVPRMIYGMAKNGQTFSMFASLSGKYNTPWVAIVFVAVITGAPIMIYGTAPDVILLLLTGASIAWLIAYIIVHIDVIVLRIRAPELHRGYKTPFFPLPQALGIAGMLYAIFHAAPKEDLVKPVYASAGLVLLAGALVAAFWVRLVMKRGLFEVEAIPGELQDRAKSQSKTGRVIKS